MFPEYILCHLLDQAIGEPQRDPLINNPGLKSVSKGFTTEVIDPVGVIVFLTLWTVPCCSVVFANGFSTASRREDEIRNESLRSFLSLLQWTLGWYGQIRRGATRMIVPTLLGAGRE
jgi:hypothetical protein